MRAVRFVSLCLFAVSTAVGAETPGVLETVFLNGEEPPTRSCHASTIEDTPQGLVVAWFGGTYEKHPDVGIWMTRQVYGEWTYPVEVATGVQYTRSDGSVHRHPTWNPVLFQYPDGPLVLFYKCGPAPDDWWGMMMSSTDSGASWSVPARLPEQIDGPVRNKPVLLEDGTLLCGSSTEFDGWRVHFEWTNDHGETWHRNRAIHDGKTNGAIQPTILKHADGSLQALCRCRNGNGQILSTTSTDGGRSWTELQPTILPNPNSGIDGVTLADGRIVLIYNHTSRSGTKPRGREMINMAVSSDGQKWKAAGILDNTEKSEFSYPAVIQSTDGLVHITYTWKRKLIRYVKVDPSQLQLKDYNGQDWPF